MMISVQVPATSANLGVLFDKGGVALDIFKNTISIDFSDRPTIDITGLGANYLPGNKNNLVYKAIERFYDSVGRKIPPIKLKMDNEIPMTRGLGSSAVCITGGIYAANELENRLLSEKDIVMLATEMEGHGDNVCAAITGGFSLYLGSEYQKIEAGDEVSFILFIPDMTLCTKKSRSVLPQKYDVDTLTKAKSLEISMVRALKDKDYETAGSLMEQDVIHQPYRSTLIPYWDYIISISKKAGVWGTALSGAGPSMISICKKSNMESIVNELKVSVDKRYKLNIIGCEINTHGIVRI